MISYLTYCLLLAIVAVLVRYRDWATPIGRLEMAVVGALCFFALVLVTRGTPLGDFVKAYYPAGRLIWEAPSELYACEVANLCFVNLPILAALFTPFSFMPLPVAGAAFTVLGVAAAAYTAWKLSGPATDVRGRMVVALFILSGPLAYSVRLGNTTHMLAPALLLGFEALSRGRQVAAGLMLAFAALIKPPLALFLVYLLLRRRFTAFLTMGASAVAVIALSLALFGLDLHLVFLNNFVFGFGAKPVIAYNVQNFSGFIGHLLLPGNLTNWFPIDEPAWFKIARLTLGGLTVLAAGGLIARAGRPAAPAAWVAELCVALCLILLVAPVTWTHYLSLLLIPMALVVSGRFELGPARLWPTTFAVAALLLSLPVLILRFGGLPGSFTQRLWISHFFAGALLLLAVLVAARLRMRIAPVGTQGHVRIAGSSAAN